MDHYKHGKDYMEKSMKGRRMKKAAKKMHEMKEGCDMAGKRKK